MELKDFQQNVLDAVDRYLDRLVEQGEQAIQLADLQKKNPNLSIPIPDFTEEAWKSLQGEGVLPKIRAGTPFSPRKDGTGKPVPAVCLKVPTGGGKTLLAAASLSHIMGKWVRRNTGFVLWIVPNESIYSQTKKALSNREHPYRQILDRASAGKVKILEKDSPLDRRDVETHLCVMLLMLQSANRQTKETLRFFRDRGSVHGFFPESDDFPAHDAVLQKTTNLDTYEQGSIATVVKDSLGNAMRVIRPIVILDEGQKAFSDLAHRTLYGFNPRFVLELSATPKDRPNAEPPMFTNWLVDVRGVDLERESMIKLPINVTVRGGDDWRSTLRISLEQLNGIQTEAERLQADTSRYIRPICLVQVERTGNDQRESGYIHAEDAKEHLMTLGVDEKEIAIKTSEKNELAQPENQDLLSPTNTIRFIITKQALQEGWDCPFAYVLCSLSPASNQAAMTQLVGRILRQPDTIKTAVPSLDECYVICHHATTGLVVDAIKEGLEKDGMGDLAPEIRESGSNGGTAVQERKIERRERFKSLQIYLPMVKWVEGGTARNLDYQQDILYRLDWGKYSLGDLAKNLLAPAQEQKDQIVKIGLSPDPNQELLDTKYGPESKLTEEFDPVFATRSIVDIVPNPWVARQIVEDLLVRLNKGGMDRVRMGARSSQIIDGLHTRLLLERDRMAEDIFRHEVEAGRIQFRLRTDGMNWEIRRTTPTAFDPNSQQLRRSDGKIVEKSLFDPFYKEELNSFERQVAGYLDSEKALKWWHRNVARKEYHVQGWRKNKVFPDFIFLVKTDGDREILYVLETKGDHLGENLDTEYKRKLLDLCSKIYKFENVTKAGELELIVDPHTTVTCSMVLESNWQIDLPALIANPS